MSEQPKNITSEQAKNLELPKIITVEPIVDASIDQQDLESVRRLRDAFKNIKQQLSRVIVGQDQVIEELLIALFSRGHCILEGVPGLAKTLMISTLAKTLSLAFSRIQFTPDLNTAEGQSEEHTSELQSRGHLVCRLLLEKKKTKH